MARTLLDSCARKFERGLLILGVGPLLGGLWLGGSIVSPNGKMSFKVFIYRLEGSIGLGGFVCFKVHS